MYGDACVPSAGKTLRQVTGLLGSDHSQLVRDAADAREELPALYGKTVGQRVRNIYIIYVAKTEAEALTALVLAHSVYNVQFSKKMHNVLYYFQKYVIGIDDGTKTNAKIMSSMAKL